MDLDTAIKGMIDSQNRLRTPKGINDPSFMSEGMMRLSQYTGAVEDHLAEAEEQYEIQWAQKYKEYIKDMKPTAAEHMTDVEMAELKGQIKRLSRIVGSSWKQVSTIQSRYNHLQKMNEGQI